MSSIRPIVRSDVANGLPPPTRTVRVRFRPEILFMLFVILSIAVEFYIDLAKAWVSGKTLLKPLLLAVAFTGLLWVFSVATDINVVQLETI